jgi:hypothetical protein
MATSAGSRLAPSGFIPDEIQHRRLIAQWEREAHQGHLGNIGSVTLGTSTAATAIVDTRVGSNSFIGLMPTTANAAQDLGLGTTYISSRSAQGFTITHANTTTADRAFVYCILG